MRKENNIESDIRDGGGEQVREVRDSEKSGGGLNDTGIKNDSERRRGRKNEGSDKRHARRKKGEIKKYLIILFVFIAMFAIVLFAVNSITGKPEYQFFGYHFMCAVYSVFLPAFAAIFGYLATKLTVLYTGGTFPLGRTAAIVNITLKIITAGFIIFMLPYALCETGAGLSGLLNYCGGGYEETGFRSSVNFGTFLNELYIDIPIFAARFPAFFSVFYMAGAGICLTGGLKQSGGGSDEECKNL